MLSVVELLTVLVLLQHTGSSVSWIPITSWNNLQARHLQVMHPPLYIPDFTKPKTQTFYSASLSPFRQPLYEFRYKVHDPKEQNYQEKAETREGDAVRGYYSVREPNGYVRFVRYVSDANGFQTQVSHHHADEYGGGYLFTEARRLT